MKPLLAALLLLVATQATPQQPASPRLVEPLDVLRISGGPFVPHRDVVVSADGSVSLPKLGMVRIAGFSWEEASSRLSRSLKRAFSASISVSRVGTKRTQVRFRGAVAEGGSLPHRQGLRLSDVAMAARPNAAADLDRIRIESGDGSVRLVSLGGPSNPDIRPGDTVFFDRLGTPAEVTVLGEVTQPGMVDFVTGLTVRQAIALAGGATGNALLTHVEVVRGESVVATLDLTKGENRVLEKGDVVRIGQTPTRNIVTVAGYVRRPGAVDFTEGMRLTKALELAGGVLRPGVDVTIIWIREGERRERFRLSDLYARKRPNPILKNGDRIEIEPIRAPAGGGL